MAMHLGIPLPRNLSRSGWVGFHHVMRAMDPRQDRGLPQHPANGPIECPDCGGDGEVGEMQPVSCERCCGEGGILDGHVDLLEQIQRARLLAHSIATRRPAYESIRRRAAMPCSGLGAMEMRARAQMCVNETDHAVAAFSRAVAA